MRLLTRNGYDFADRVPLIVDAVAALRARSCIIDGEAVACDGNGPAVFELLRYQRQDQIVTLCAFDLIEREGKDLRTMPLEERKHTLANLLCGSPHGIAFNQHYEDDGAIIYQHACALGCEGIVSKPAESREAEEDWS